MLYPWQQELIKMTARQLGKSQLTQQAIDRYLRDIGSQPISELVLSEGRVHGARYYCVEPIGGNWMDMEVWALDTYGGTGSMWGQADNNVAGTTARWYMNDRKFWFRTAKDRDWFIIRWSCS